MHSPNEVFAAFFDFGKHVLSSAINAVTGVIQLQTGNAVDATADSDAAELYGPPGYYALPADPTPGAGGTETCIIKNSDHDAVIGVRDTRDSQIYGKLKPGERCIAAGFPAQGRILWKANGAVVIYTTSDNTPSGVAVMLYIGPDKIQIANQYGSATLGPGGWTMATADGTAGLVLAPGSATLAGTSVAVSGTIAAIAGTAATCLGSLSAPTPGLPGPTSVLVGPACTPASGKPSQTVFCSP